MICCLCRRCINSRSFIHLLDRFVFHCKRAACVSWACIARWRRRAAGIFMEAVWARWFEAFRYLFLSRKRCRAGRDEVKHCERVERILLRRSRHASGGSQVSLCLEKWFCMQRDGQGALLRAGCIVLWSNLVVLSSHHGCNAPLSPSLALPPTSLVAPFIPSVFSPLTLRSLPLSCWVSQLTIWPTKDPRRLSSTTVQAVTGWERTRGGKRQGEGTYSIHHPPW